MTPALLAALTVVAAGLAVRPAPPARRPDDSLRVGGGGARLRGRRHDLIGRRGRVRARSAPEEVAGWCADIARATRSGSTLGAAIRGAAGPPHASTTIAALHLALDRGVGLATALEHAAARTTGDPDLQLALTVLRACAEHGGPPSEPVDRAAATLRMRAADLADRHTHSAQARLSAVVMTWLPLVMLGVLLATSPPVRGAVATTPGITVLLLGGALNVAGWRWMRRIIGAHR